MEFYNSKVVSPVITKHPYRDYFVIRYNEPHNPNKGKFINIPKLNFIGVEKSNLAEFHIDLK